MLSWQNRKPQKSEYERMTDEYQKVFGEPWIEKIGFGDSVEQTIAKIKDCIKNNRKQQLQGYSEGMIY